MPGRPSILILACDNYLAGIYGRKFELDGWEVEIAESLSEAERKAIKMRPSIIMLDSQSADDICVEIERFKAMPTIQKSKVIILAENGERKEIERALEAGADDYLLQGHFVPHEAVVKMRKLISSR